MPRAPRFLITIAAAAALQLPATTRTVVLTLTEGTSMSAAVSPDRRWIAFDLIGRLWIMPFSGGEARPITPPLLEARQPTWSPDSNRLAFQGYDDSAWHIYLVDRDGNDVRAVTSGEYDDREPAWAHDGETIAFSSDRYGGRPTVWLVDASSGSVRQYSMRDATMPAWSPNDRELTVTSSDRFASDGTVVPDAVRRPGLWAVRGDQPDRLIVDARLARQNPAAVGWSADGMSYAFTTVDGGLVLGGRGSPGPGGGVSRTNDCSPFRPQFIGNGELLFVANGHIYRSPLGNLRSDQADGAPGGLRATAIPFTATVTLERTTYTIAHRDLEPAGRQTVAGIVTPVVAPNGAAVAFVALGDLWVMPIGEAPVRLTDDEAVELDPTWSPDGTQIAYASDRGGRMQLWIRDLASARDSQVGETRGTVSNLSWSPDGSHIAYLIDRRTVVATRVRAGDGRGGTAPPGGAQPLPDTELGRPTWAPDSRSVAVGALIPYSDRYREGLNQLLHVPFDGRSTTAVVLSAGQSAGNRQTGGPVWSLDGTQMAFVSEGRLWTVGVDTGGSPTNQAHAIADDAPESPSWEADSRHLVYQTPSGLRRVLSDGSIPQPIAVDLTWTPQAPPARLVVHAGRVFDGTFEGLRGESDIVIEGGIIREVTGHRDELHAGTVVDASSEVVMPGFVESHAHLDPDYGASFGRAWLAYGITSVRIPAINPYAGIELRESFESGRRPGPRVFLAGDPFDGPRIYYPGGVSVRSDDQVEREFERLQSLGMDFFKTYVRLPDRLQKRVVSLAHAVGKPVTSHELFPAVAFGIDGVEHLRGTSRRGYSPKASATNHAYRDVTETIVQSGITLTPTIGILGGFAARTTGDRSLLSDPRLGLFPLPVVGRLTDLATAPPDPALDARIREYERTLAAVASQGGRIVAGTDAPIDPYGLGLHVELESYVHAGLSAFQALQTATINAAQGLGVDDQLGSIEAGKLADLTFVAGDPLADIRATRDVRRVMKGGRLYTVNGLVQR